MSVAAPKAVDLHLLGKPDSRLVQVIANIGEPKSITLQNGETVRRVIEARCGIVDPVYVAALLEQNQILGRKLTAPDLDRSSGNETVIFPACIRIESASYEVRQEETISEIYSARGLPLDAKAIQDALSNRNDIGTRTLGSIKGLKVGGDSHIVAVANRGFVASEYARQFIEDNPQIDPRGLKPGEVIKVAPQQMVATIPVRESTTLPSALEQLQTVVGSSVQYDKATVAELVEDTPLDPDVCAGNLDLDVWPIPVHDLREALDQNTALRPDSVNYHPTTVLIIDTGLVPAMQGRAVPKASLGVMRSFDGRSLRKYTGVNTATLENDATPPKGLLSPFHGGEVAATLLGGRFLEAYRSTIPLPQVTFASIAQQAGGNSYLDIGAIGTAYRRALDSNIPIINASISASYKRDGFITELKQGGGATLVVAAAGNTKSLPQEFEGTIQPWPGSMGGSPLGAAPGLVVSVGAHGPKGQLLPFSRAGKTQVDLLAPGCRIPTFSYEPGTGTIIEKDRNGTSYAAPIVALVAALLSSETLSPAAIKDRLIVSVDMDEALAAYVYSAGRLDVRKALSVYRDVAQYVVRDASGSVIRDSTGTPIVHWVSGRLLTGNKHLEVCEEKLSQKDLRKLAVTNGAAGQIIRGWRTPVVEQQGTAIARIEKCSAVPALQGEMIFETEAGQETRIALADIIDFVAKEPW